MIPSNWKLALPPGLFEHLIPLGQQAKKGVTVLVGVMTLTMKGKVGDHCIMQAGKSVSGKQSSRASFRTFKYVIKVDGKL